MKKFYSLAFISGLLLLGCTADGMFSSAGANNAAPNIVWGDKDASSNSKGFCAYTGGCSYVPGATCSALGGSPVAQCPSTSPGGGDDNVGGGSGNSCVYSFENIAPPLSNGAFICAENTESECLDGEGTPRSGPCNIATYEYCIYTNGPDIYCDRVGGSYIGSKSECRGFDDMFGYGEYVSAFATRALCEIMMVVTIRD